MTAYLKVEGAARAIEFYKEAFGAVELSRQAMPDGKLLHASLRLGDSTIMMSDAFPEVEGETPAAAGAGAVTLHLYCEDVDAVWERALVAGAKATMPLEDQFWGERYGKLVDPFGHHWSLSTPVEMSEAEREAKRREAMAFFGSGEDPGTEG